MSTDAPESPPAARASVLFIAAVPALAAGIPVLLALDARAAVTVALGVLAAAGFTAAALRVRRPDAAHVGPARPGPEGAMAEATTGDRHQRETLTLPDGGPPPLTPAATPLPAAHHAVPHATHADHAPDRSSATAHHADAPIPAADTLIAQVERQRAELQTLTRRLMTVQEDERASLSRELHDDIGQAITAIKLCASSLAHEPDPPRRAVVQETAGEIAAIADQTVAKLRDLSLLLRPPQLDALGLDAALRWQAGALFRGDAPMLVLDIPPLACRPPRDIELACFRIAQEALTNVLRHAHARHVRLRLDCDETDLRLHIDDDGVGIAPDHRAGLGLITMRERASQAGGRLDLDSRPGRTCIDVTLPLPRREAQAD